MAHPKHGSPPFGRARWPLVASVLGRRRNGCEDTTVARPMSTGGDAFTRCSASYAPRPQRYGPFVHVVWSTHRRAPWLDVSFDQRLAELLARLSRRVGTEALAVGNAADQVHAVVRHPPSVALSDVVQRLKGASARAMHAAIPHAVGHLWQVGYWAESVSPIQLPAVVVYVHDQRSHHDLHREPTEPWEAWVP